MLLRPLATTTKRDFWARPGHQHTANSFGSYCDSCSAATATGSSASSSARQPIWWNGRSESIIFDSLKRTTEFEGRRLWHLLAGLSAYGEPRALQVASAIAFREDRSSPPGFARAPLGLRANHNSGDGSTSSQHHRPAMRQSGRARQTPDRQDVFGDFQTWL